MLLGVLEHLFGVLTALKSLKNGQNAHFSTFRAEFLGPLAAKLKKRRHFVRLGLKIICANFRKNPSRL